MRLATARRMLGQDLLAREGRIAPPSARIPAHVAVGVADVVAVFLVEGIIGDVPEGGAPEAETLVQTQADALQEKGILEAGVVFEVGVLPQREMQVAHAEGEVRGEGIDGGGGGGGAGEEAVGVGEGGGGGGEGFGEVVEDGGEAVVFVEAGEGAGRELEA